MNNSIIDGLVAEKVMGWSKKYYPSSSYAYWEKPTGTESIPAHHFRPSGELTHAWQVVQQLESEGIEWAIGTIDGPLEPIGARFGTQDATGRTVAEAVCIAALKFKGVDM